MSSLYPLSQDFAVMVYGYATDSGKPSQIVSMSLTLQMLYVGYPFKC